MRLFIILLTLYLLGYKEITILYIYFLLSLIDLKIQIVPLKFIMLLILISFLNEFSIFNLVNGMMLFIFFYLLALVFFIIKKEEGLGGGDIMLSFIIGYNLGFIDGINCFMLASILGIIAIKLFNIKILPLVPFISISYIIRGFL